jgi:Polysaccharide lyase
MPRVRLGHLIPLVACCLVLPTGAAAAAGSEQGSTAERPSTKKKTSSAERGAKRSAERRATNRRRARAAKRRNAARRRLSRQRRTRSGLGHQIALARRDATVSENSDVLFRGDFESGFEGWHVQSLSSRANLFSAGTFQGSGAARFEVQDGDVEPETGSPRSEVSGPTFDAGQDLYFRDAIRIPSASSYEGPWQIVQQLHEEDWDGSPGIAVFLESDDTLRIGRGDGDATYWESGELQRDRWYDLVYRVYLSQDSGAGFVEVWLDGVQQTTESGGARAYGETIQAAQTYLKAGIYRSRSSNGTSLVEHDSIVVGTSLGAVMAG